MGAVTGGPAKCGGCDCQYANQICFRANPGCLEPDGCLMYGWNFLNVEGDTPDPATDIPRPVDPAPSKKYGVR